MIPEIRMRPQHPFSYAGIHYFGPLFVREIQHNTTTKKIHGCIFTCLTTKAIHLELLRDMTALEFSMTVRKFSNRRGLPAQFITDNGSNIKVIKEVFQRVNDKVQWKFIPELAPWMGGCYERLISIVKRCLRKTISHKMLSHSELETVFLSTWKVY